MKKIIALFLTLLLTFMCMAPAVSAASISPDTYYQTGASVVLDGIQKNEYQNDNGTKIIEYTNIGDYVDSMLARRSSTLSSYDLAKSIALKIEGDAAEHLPEKYIMETLTFQSAVQSVSYIKMKSDGTQEYLTESEMMAAIAATQGAPKIGARVSDTDIPDDDGYMELTTTAYAMDTPDYCIDDRNHYYVVSVTARWLKEPKYKLEDALALAYGGAIFNDNYEDFAHIWESVICTGCHETGGFFYYETASKEGRQYSEEDAKEHLEIIYPSGSAGIAAYVNFVEPENAFICLHDSGSENNQVNNQKFDLMQSYIRSSVYSQGSDFSISSAYSHKWVGLTSLSVSISSGLDASIGFSILGMHKDYFARPITVTYLSEE